MLALVVGFESLQQHKRRRILRVHCSVLTDQNIGDFHFFFFGPFSHYISDLSLGTDISVIFWRFLQKFLPSDFSPRNIVSTPPDTRYIGETFSSLDITRDTQARICMVEYGICGCSCKSMTMSIACVQWHISTIIFYFLFLISGVEGTCPF